MPQFFNEVYQRNFMNDEGTCASGPGLSTIIDDFVVSVGQLQFTLSQQPNYLYPAFIYVNQILKRPNVDYLINSRTVQFADNVLSTNDSVIARYMVVPE